MPRGITQCYLPPGGGDIPALTPAEAGTRLSDPGGMQGWVDLKCNWSGLFPSAFCRITSVRTAWAVLIAVSRVHKENSGGNSGLFLIRLPASVHYEWDYWIFLTSIHTIPCRKRQTQNIYAKNVHITESLNKSLCSFPQTYRRREFPPTTCRLGIVDENVPIQLAQCWFPGLAISSAKI